MFYHFEADFELISHSVYGYKKCHNPQRSFILRLRLEMDFISECSKALGEVCPRVFNLNIE